MGLVGDLSRSSADLSRRLKLLQGSTLLLYTVYTLNELDVGYSKVGKQGRGVGEMEEAVDMRLCMCVHTLKPGEKRERRGIKRGWVIIIGAIDRQQG